MEDVAKETWNKKRVFFGIFLLLLLIVGGYLLKTRVFTDQSQQLKSVEGVSIKTDVPQPDLGANLQETVKEKINDIKQEVSGLNIVEIASSSPQMQKVLNDIKDLQQYPTNQIKELCRKICGL